jgi:hypothetical protein
MPLFIRCSGTLAALGVLVLTASGCSSHAVRKPHAVHSDTVGNLNNDVAIPVPRVNGSHLDDALRRLHLAGLRATFKTATMTCGYTDLPRVRGQMPRAGTRVPSGSAVTFEFAHEFGLMGGGGGKTHVVVPSLVGLSQQTLAEVMVHVPIRACVHVQGAHATTATHVVLAAQRPAPATRVWANGVHVNGGFRPSTVTLYYELRHAAPAPHAGTIALAWTGGETPIPLPRSRARFLSPTRLAFLTWGSGSCPALPTKLTVLGRHAVRLRLSVYNPTHGGCTMDDSTKIVQVAIDPHRIDVHHRLTVQLRYPFSHGHVTRLRAPGLVPRTRSS